MALCAYRSPPETKWPGVPHENQVALITQANSLVLPSVQQIGDRKNVAKRQMHPRTVMSDAPEH